MIDEKKVGELVRYLMFSSMNDRIEIITEWFEQNQPEPVVVGLSEKQVIGLANYIFNSKKSIALVREDIEEYLKTQTFAQIEEIQDLKTELEQLKSQQFVPDWGDTPKNVNIVYLEWTYYCDNEIAWSRNVVDSEFHRPQPTPQVEVGQVWENKEIGLNFTVSLVQEVADGYLISCSMKCDDKSLAVIWEGNNKNFLENFERVS